MKTITLLIVIIIFSITLLSCNENGNHEDLIKVNNKNIVLWAGQDTILHILSDDRDYYIESNNELVARGSIISKEIHILTNHSGEAILTIRNKTGEKVSLNISARSFKGGWEVLNSNTFTTSVKVVATDLNFAEQLQNEILEEIKTKKSYTYNFHNKNSVLINNEIEGVFLYNSLTLKINYDKIEDIYIVEPISVSFVKLTQDKTQYYSNKYLDKNISKVSIVNYWRKYTQ